MQNVVDQIAIALFECDCGGPSAAYVLAESTTGEFVPKLEARTYEPVCLKCKKVTTKVGPDMVTHRLVEWRL